MGTLCLITAVSTRKLEESAEGKRRKQGQLGTWWQGQIFAFMYATSNYRHWSGEERNIRNNGKYFWLMAISVSLGPYSSKVQPLPAVTPALTQAEAAQPLQCKLSPQATAFRRWECFYNIFFLKIPGQKQNCKLHILKNHKNIKYRNNLFIYKID